MRHRKTLSFFPIVSTQTFCIVESAKKKNKDCRCENRQRSFTITNQFQRRKQSYTRIDLCKRCLTLVSVCSEMGKKRRKHC